MPNIDPYCVSSLLSAGRTNATAAPKHVESHNNNIMIVDYLYVNGRRQTLRPIIDHNHNMLRATNKQARFSLLPASNETNEIIIGNGMADEQYQQQRTALASFKDPSVRGIRPQNEHDSSNHYEWSHGSAITTNSTPAIHPLLSKEWGFDLSVVPYARRRPLG